MMNPECASCGNVHKTMKRCTKCRKAYYCSRDCQMTDWTTHKLQCQNMLSESSGIESVLGCDAAAQKSKANIKSTFDQAQQPKQPSTLSSGFLSNTTESSSYDFSADCSVQPRQTFKISWSEGSSKVVVKKKTETEAPNSADYHPRINFHKAAAEAQTKSAVKNGGVLKKDESKSKPRSSDQPTSVSQKTYLNENQIYKDLPETLEDREIYTITVRAHKEKHKVRIQEGWSGSEILKVLSHALYIPLDSLKVIHKGKVMTSETISAHICDKALFQALGEQAEDENGLSSEDINTIMRQLQVGRNVAVKSLREKGGDILEAILHLGNK